MTDAAFCPTHDASGDLRELVLVLTIPYLYWVFVRVGIRRHKLLLERAHKAESL